MAEGLPQRPPDAGRGGQGTRLGEGPRVSRAFNGRSAWTDYGITTNGLLSGTFEFVGSWKATTTGPTDGDRKFKRG